MSIEASKDAGSIYMALADRLRSAIQSGQYRPGDLIGSEHELARAESISRMTVRRASELLVNEGYLERRPGKGLYVCHRPASAVGLIQVIAGNLTWEPCLQVARGVQTAARERGVQVQLYDAHGDEELDMQVMRELPKGPAKGAVIISTHSSAFNEAMFGLKTSGFPFVLVDQRLHDIEVPSVVSDNYDGGHQVARLLVENGHRRIAFIGDLVASTVQDRLDGLRDGLGDAGLPFDRGLVCDLVVDQDRLGDWSSRVESAFSQLMSQSNPPTAVFCSCDAVARSVYRAAGKLGVRIPEDVSVVGFDDDPLAEWLTPALTSVRQPFREMGRRAVELLGARLADPNKEIEHSVLPVELISRASVSRPGKNANSSGGKS